MIPVLLHWLIVVGIVAASIRLGYRPQRPDALSALGRCVERARNETARGCGPRAAHEQRRAQCRRGVPTA